MFQRRISNLSFAGQLPNTADGIQSLMCVPSSTLPYNLFTKKKLISPSNWLTEAVYLEKVITHFSLINPKWIMLVSTLHQMKFVIFCHSLRMKKKKCLFSETKVLSAQESPLYALLRVSLPSWSSHRNSLSRWFSSASPLFICPLISYVPGPVSWGHATGPLPPGMRSTADFLFDTCLH